MRIASIPHQAEQEQGDFMAQWLKQGATAEVIKSAAKEVLKKLES